MQHRYAAIDLCLVVQKVLPIAVNVFGRTDDPSILWPLVNLLSSTIVKV